MSGIKRVAIVGAGISGLAAAFYLQRDIKSKGLDVEITLIEKSAQAGGVIRTEKVGDLLLEWGPENFVALRPLILDLINDVGLSDELIGSNDDRRQTYVVHDGVLQPLPEGMAFLSPVDIRSFWSTKLISTSGKLRACFEPFIPKSKGDLSAYDFISRRLGKELTERIAEPLVSAIYGGDASKLSLASALPETYYMEQKYGSLWRGMRTRQKAKKGKSAGSQPFFRSLRGGMSGLVQGLIQQMPEVSFVWDAQDTSVTPKSGGYALTAGGLDAFFDAVVVSTPAPAAAEIIEPVSASGAGLLREIPYTSSWLVYLAYDRAGFSHPLNGFGFVTPNREAGVLDACTWVSTKFDERCPEDTVLLRCAIHNGRHDRDSSSESEIIGRVRGELKRLMGVTEEPKFSRAAPAAGSMAQPTVNHGERLKRLGEELASHEGLYLSSAYTSGVGVPSCVSGGQMSAVKVVRHLFPKA